MNKLVTTTFELFVQLSKLKNVAPKSEDRINCRIACEELESILDRHGYEVKYIQPNNPTLVKKQKEVLV